MSSTTGLQNRARRALLVTTLLAAGAFAFFATRDEPTTGVIVAGLFFAWGYFEYRRRQRDIEAIDSGQAEDPLERRNRRR